MPVPKSKQQQADRPVVYDEIKIMKCIGEGNGLTVEQAKQFLGWEVIPEGAGKAVPIVTVTERVVVDGEEKEQERRIRCVHNLHNRPFRRTDCERYVQEHLTRNWQPNGETIIIGRHGSVLSGQHRLISLILAELERTGKQANHWADNWPGPVTMECIVVLGVSEEPKVVRTLDNVIPRDLSDVLFTEGAFSSFKGGERKTVIKMLEYSIRYLWHRTQADQDAFTPHRTHSEALEFRSRHPRLDKAVKHVWDEYSANWKVNSARFSAGYASGLLYLMGASGSDPDLYRNAEQRSEKQVDWSQWDKACEFWTLLSQTAVQEDFKPVIDALARLQNPEGQSDGSLAEKTAILITAWNLFKDGKPITDKDMRRLFGVTEDGDRVLNFQPVCGGVDFGEGKAGDEGVDAEEDEGDEDEGAAGKIGKVNQRKTEVSSSKAPKAPTMRDILTQLRKENGDKVLLFKTSDRYNAFDEDAKTVALKIGVKAVKAEGGMLKTSFLHSDLDMVVTRLHEAAHEVAVVEQMDGQMVVKAAKSSTGKPPAPKLIKPAPLKVPPKPRMTEAEKKAMAAEQAQRLKDSEAKRKAAKQ